MKVMQSTKNTIALTKEKLAILLGIPAGVPFTLEVKSSTFVVDTSVYFTWTVNEEKDL